MELLGRVTEDLEAGQPDHALDTLRHLNALLAARGDTPPSRPAADRLPPALQRRLMTCPGCGAAPGAFHDTSCEWEEHPRWG
jgi:hypothetical protein